MNKVEYSGKKKKEKKKNRNALVLNTFGSQPALELYKKKIKLESYTFCRSFVLPFYVLCKLDKKINKLSKPVIQRI